MAENINEKIEASYHKASMIVEEEESPSKETNKNEKATTSVRWTGLDTLGVIGFGLGIEAIVTAAFGWIVIYGIVFSLVSLVSSIIGLIFSKKGLDSASLKVIKLKKAGLIINIITLIASIIFFIVSIILTIIFFNYLVDNGSSAY